MKTLHGTPSWGWGVGSPVSLLSGGKCKLGLSAGGWAAVLSSPVYPRDTMEESELQMGIFHIKWH